MAKRRNVSYSGPVSCCFLCSFAVVASIGSLYVAEDWPKKVLPKPPLPETVATPAAVPPVAAYALKFAVQDVPAELPHTASPQTAQPQVAQPQLEAVKAPEKPQETCSRIAFLRIQKTASTTFGQEIMSQMCGRYKQTCKQNWELCAFSKGKCSLELFQYHLEYNQARKSADAGPSRGCVVTFLRDPVERTMSEFFMLREKHRQFLSFDQWDVHQDDLGELDAILNLPNLSESFMKYLHHGRNPSRNRQSLYLLGFERLHCNKTRCGGNACICANESFGYPGTAYDWDKDETLMEKVKERLKSLEAFGLTDCFLESIKAMAPRLGWNVTKSVELAEKHQDLHVWMPTMEKAKAIHRRLSFTGPSRNWWREFVTPEVQREIQRVNSLDVELVTFAKQLFERSYGRPCQLAP